MSDRDISSWDVRLADQVRRGWNNYVRRRIDLSTARTDDMISIAGEFLYVEEVSSDSALASLKLNRNTNDSFDLRRGVVLKTIFERLYFTHTAQAGEWIDLIVGVNFDYQVRGIQGRAEIAQPSFYVTNAVINTDTQAAAHICNSVLCRSDPDNTGLVKLNFGAAVSATSYVPLKPGDWISVLVSNTNQIHASFAVANEKLFVCYQV